jgi:hypothetical protein
MVEGNVDGFSGLINQLNVTVAESSSADILPAQANVVACKHLTLGREEDERSMRGAREEQERRKRGGREEGERKTSTEA